jgi:dienelactone hydrolase
MAMRLRLTAISLALLASACAKKPFVLPETVRGDLPTHVDGFVRELTRLEVHYLDGTTAQLEALITRPDRPGQFPLVLMNHGTPRDATERVKLSPTSTSGHALLFARRGYAVVQVMRRAYGKSSNDYAEDSGPCDHKEYGPGVRASADDVLAALRALQREPWVDPTRVLLLGVSAGGLAAVAAAATNPRGVIGVISFAGGRGSPAPDQVCDAKNLIALEAELGRTGRVPELWVYAQNDHFFSPALAQQLHAAYTGAGGVAELVKAPPFGEDGHMLFMRAPPQLWWQYVEPMLQLLGLPTDEEQPRPPPRAALPPDAPPKTQAAFADYLTLENHEKAFALGGGGAFGWAGGKRTRQEAADEALKICVRRGSGCKIFAIGDGPAP